MCSSLRLTLKKCSNVNIQIIPFLSQGSRSFYMFEFIAERNIIFEHEYKYTLYAYLNRCIYPLIKACQYMTKQAVELT